MEAGARLSFSSAALSDSSLSGSLLVQGAHRLTGRVEIGGARNAALPLMAATVLTPAVHTLRNLPLLSDTLAMAQVLEALGARVEFRGHACKIDTSTVSSFDVPRDLVRTVRTGIYVLAPLLARFGRARVALPHGASASDTVGPHVDGLNAMNAGLEVGQQCIVGTRAELRGAAIVHENVSVEATAEILMAAVLAAGTTTLHNAALDPDVTALAEVLAQSGAEIQGIGTRRLTIHGVSHLRPIDATIIPDRIEAATFLAAAAITNGNVTLERCEAGHMAAAIHKLEEIGCELLPGNREMTIAGPVRPVASDVATGPYPGFPTEVQAQMTAVLSIAHGASMVSDAIDPDGFTHVPELERMGADIRLDGDRARIRGVSRLRGTPVTATDIRSGSALLLAALAADGETRISRIDHLDHGYENLIEKLLKLGAVIERIAE